MGYKDAAHQINDRSRKLTPYEAYTASETQKRVLADNFLDQLVAQYKTIKADGSEGAPPQAMFAAAVDAKLESGAELRKAVAGVYPDIIKAYGITRVDPRKPGALREFYDAYEPNFPLDDERESFSGFKEILATPATPTGYLEVADTIKCPLTGRVLGGANYSMIPESNSVHFVYGFLAPEARGLGLSRTMLEVMEKNFEAHKREGGYATEFPNALIAIEKNDLREMDLPSILRDSAGIRTKRPPREGDNLTRSAMGQSLRDAAWAANGFRLVPVRYIQSSLDGVVEVPKAEEENAIAHLVGDPRLGDAEKARAEKALTEARGDKMDACLSLVFCVKSAAPLVDMKQVMRHQRIFQGISVLDDPDNVGRDIYFKAMMADMSAKPRFVLSQPIPAVGAATFRAADAVTKDLLQRTDWKEINAHPERTYGEWLDISAAQPEAQPPARAPRAGTGVKPRQTYSMA
jgi:hypothetical protein